MIHLIIFKGTNLTNASRFWDTLKEKSESHKKTVTVDCFNGRGRGGACLLASSLLRKVAAEGLIVLVHVRVRPRFVLLMDDGLNFDKTVFCLHFIFHF